MRPGTLYTITELTELTEDPRGWRPVSQHTQAPTNPYLHPGGSRATLMSSVTTDYGQVIGEPHLHELEVQFGTLHSLLERAPHPEELAATPSLSALQRLSFEEGSATPTPRRTPSSSTDTIPAPSASGVVPTFENLPDIPDLKSK